MLTTKEQKTEKINWFKQIPSEYLYLNESKKNSIEKRLNKKFNEVAKEEALETELIINLAGIRFLLDKVGYKYSKITINSCNPEYAAATCEICFNAGEYNENQEQVYSQSASAHRGNTKSWYAEYLVEAAANRAFCRAVRFYCNVQCVSSEEMGANVQEENNAQSGPNPQVDLLQKELDKIKCTFEQFKHKMIKENIPNAETFKTLNDIPRDVIFTYIERLKTAKAKKAE